MKEGILCGICDWAWASGGFTVYGAVMAALRKERRNICYVSLVARG